MMNMQELATIAQYQPAGEGLHSQQRLYGNGAAVAGTAARRRAIRKAIWKPARFRETRGSVSAWSGCAPPKPGEVDDLIDEMLAIDRPVIADVQVDPKENCLPDDPVGRGAQRNAAGSRTTRRKNRSPKKAWSSFEHG